MDTPDLNICREIRVARHVLMVGMADELIHGELTDQIIGAAIEVHRCLGPGLLENIYESCLAHELTLRGLSFQQQQKLDVVYKGIAFEKVYFLDLFVENKVVVEVKSVEQIGGVHAAQLRTYMRLTGACVGLLINFHAPTIRSGLLRRVL